MQGIASLLLPARHALLPALALLLYRLVHSLMMAAGVIPNSQMDGVVMGKFTAQPPAKDGSPPTGPAEQDIVVIILAARSNHPLGLFAKGYRELGNHISAMVTDLWEHSEEYGCKYQPPLFFSTVLLMACSLGPDLVDRLQRTRYQQPSNDAVLLPHH